MQPTFSPTSPLHTSLKLAALLAVATVAGATSDPSVGRDDQGNILLTVPEGNDVAVQVGDAEPEKIAAHMRASRRVAENVDDINSAVVYLAKQNQREESSVESACESAGDSSSSSSSTATLYTDMTDVRGRMFIEAYQFVSADGQDPDKIGDGTTVVAFARGLIPCAKSHPLAYNCNFAWGSHGHTSSSKAATIEIGGATDAFQLTCEVPTVPSGKLDSGEYFLRFTGITTAMGHTIAMVPVKGTDVGGYGKTFETHGPVVSMDDSSTYTLTIDSTDSSPHVISFSLSDLDNTALDFESVELTVASTHLNKDKIVLTTSGSIRTITIPADAVLAYATSNIVITVTDKQDNSATATIEFTTEEDAVLPSSCYEIYKAAPTSKTGFYTIYPLGSCPECETDTAGNGAGHIKVHCLMEHGGGWTLVGHWGTSCSVGYHMEDYTSGRNLDGMKTLESSSSVIGGCPAHYSKELMNNLFVNQRHIDRFDDDIGEYLTVVGSSCGAMVHNSVINFGNFGGFDAFKGVYNTAYSQNNNHMRRFGATYSMNSNPIGSGTYLDLASQISDIHGRSAGRGQYHYLPDDTDGCSFNWLYRENKNNSPAGSYGPVDEVPSMLWIR